MASSPIDSLRERIAQGELQGVYLVVGDLVVAEPAGRAVGEALGARLGVEPEVHRRPPSLQSLLGDLKTYSLFDTGKVRVVIESALLADRNSAAELLDQAGEGLPIEASSELTARQRVAATRLLQALRVFAVDPESATPQRVLAQLPAWAFQGGPKERKKRNQRARGKRQVADLRAGLESLLAVALETGMVGWAEGDLAQLGVLVEEGLPPGHHLVLVESSAPAEHPITQRLSKVEAVVQVGSVSIDRRGALEGLQELAAALVDETGVKIQADALREMASRTLRKGRGTGVVDAVSTGRFAAEYRKLANLSEGSIDLRLVKSAVEDRGEEDVFGLLDEISAGNVGAALKRLERHLHSSEDPGAAVFGFFALLAQYAQHIAAIRGMLEHLGARRVERNYRRFQAELLPRLQSAPGAGLANPVAGLHPYRLHRVYLAAARWSSAAAKRLPWMVLEAETRLKGDSSAPATVLSDLVARLARASVGSSVAAPSPERGGRRPSRPGSGARRSPGA